MCGIAGIFNFTGEPAQPEDLQRMTDVIRHRGPDDEGFFTDRFVGLGFRRLSILDLSPSGHQPMSSMDGSVWIVFNGEIYNYIEIREDLKAKGHSFRSQTDTEVIIAAYREWGIDCLSRFNGMWAFAIWDKNKNELFCARDRFGVKPFYYYVDRRCFLFASEIKCLLDFDGVDRVPNRRVIYNFLVDYKRDWSDETFFEPIRQLQPGHYAVISPDGVSIRNYYSLNLERSAGNGLSDDEVTAQFYRLFEDSVRLHLRSDVPVGSCLSGGLDSSAIVCVINKIIRESGQALTSIGSIQKTFSAYSENPALDERQYMDAVISRTDAEKNTTTPTAADLVRQLNAMIWYHEEPFASTSIYAQYCVMKIAHERGMKVLLDGQGSDEIFGGYDHAYYPYLSGLIRRGRLFQCLAEIRRLRRHGLKWSAGATAKVLLGAGPASANNRIINALWLRLPHGIHKDFIRNMHGVRGLAPRLENGLKEKLFNDMNFILRSLLAYEDKNSMAFSIEARVPFLDYRLVEFVFSLPDRYKISSSLRKILLRRAMKNIVPDIILNRTDKIGFATAEKDWLASGPLRNIMLDVFRSARFRQREYFDPHTIIDAFETLPARPEQKSSINFWACFHLEMWLRQFIDRR